MERRSFLKLLGLGAAAAALTAAAPGLAEAKPAETSVADQTLDALGSTPQEGEFAQYYYYRRRRRPYWRRRRRRMWRRRRRYWRRRYW